MREMGHLLIVELGNGGGDLVGDFTLPLLVDAPEELLHGAVVDAWMLLCALHRVCLARPCHSQVEIETQSMQSRHFMHIEGALISAHAFMPAGVQA